MTSVKLIRFQTLSKHWRCLIRSRGFGKRYASHQKTTKDPKLLLVCQVVNPRAQISSLRLATLALKTSTKPTSPEDRLFVEFEKSKGFLEISESCDGLVCIYALTKAVEVINPVTANFEALPLAEIQRLCTDHPDIKADHPDLEAELVQGQDPVLVPAPVVSFTRFGFGKDSVTGRYKLVWLYNRYPATTNKEVGCEVLDLEDKKWRFVSTRPLLDHHHHHVLYNQRPAFANGSFYWLTGDEQGGPSTQTKLIVFDIHTEMFQVTETPPFITRDASGDKIGLCNLDGRLCISELKRDCKQDFWWRVKEDNSNTWTWEKIFSVDLRSTSTWFNGITSQPLTPLAISRDKNKVILSLTYLANLVAFDRDPGSTTVYQLYHSGFYGLSVPYFPNLSLSFDT
uniref:Putative F-box protein n=1 Tax=Eutrema halophilum TaxID=98038 RepID=C7SI22_EUTHA|nr:putative F-box protein [Eutrema halophilum]